MNDDKCPKFGYDKEPWQRNNHPKNSVTCLRNQLLQAYAELAALTEKYDATLAYLHDLMDGRIKNV